MVYFINFLQRKIKPKAPSPVAPQDEDDSRQSGEGRVNDVSRVPNAEMIDSDSDTESSSQVTQKTPIKRVTNLPSSSSSTSSASSEEDQSSTSSSSESSSSSDTSDDEIELDTRPLARDSKNPEVLIELAIQRSLQCRTPIDVPRTPIPKLEIYDGPGQNDFPQIDDYDDDIYMEEQQSIVGIKEEADLKEAVAALSEMNPRFMHPPVEELQSSMHQRQHMPSEPVSLKLNFVFFQQKNKKKSLSFLLVY